MESRYRYDLPTAVTFLLAGLGVGSLLTLIFSARFQKLGPVTSSAGRGQPAGSYSDNLPRRPAV